MSDIDIAIRRTKVKFFGPLPKFHVRRAKNVFMYRAELGQNNGVRAE